MPEIGSAWISILPSAKGFGSKLNKQVGGGVVSAGKSIGKAFGAAIVAGGAVAATAGAIFLKGAISEAANLEQSVGAIDTVFKKSAGQMHKWSKGAATDVGLTRNEFNELGTLIGTQLRNGGTAMDELAPKTNKLIGLGADLSSMFGGTTKDAVAALSSALKGERDPIEAYGVSLNQAKIDAEAAALGFEKVGGSLSAEANQAATLSLIMKQTADAHGNFARESDTLAHKQQVLSAQFGNFKAQVGTALLPVILKLLNVMEKRVRPAMLKMARAVVPVVAALRDKLEPVVRRVMEFFKENPEVLKGAAIGLGVLAAAIGVVSLAMGVLAVATSPITLIILAVAALGAGIAYLWKNSETFRGVVTKLGKALASFGAFLKAEILPIIVETAQTVAKRLQPVWRALAEFFKGSVVPMLTLVAAKMRGWWPVIQKVIVFLAKLIGKSIQLWAAIQGKLMPILLKTAGVFLRAFVPAGIAVVSTVVKIIGKIIAFGAALVNGGRRVINFQRGIATMIGKVLGWFSALPGRVINHLGSVGSLLYNAGRDLIQGMMNGVRSMAQSLANAAKDVVKGAVDGAKDFLGINSPSRVFRQIGVWTMEGLEQGVDKGAPGVQSRVEAVAAGVAATNFRSPSLSSAASTLSTFDPGASAVGQTPEGFAAALAQALHNMGLTLQIGRDAAGKVVLVGQNVIEQRT